MDGLARGAVFEADPKHIKLPAILQLAESELITGSLEVEGAGAIDLQSGQIVAARTEHGFSGLEAVYELFFVDAGRLRLRLDSTILGAALGATIAVIMDACKLLDDWAMIANERWVLAAAPSEQREHERDLAITRPWLDAMDSGLTLDELVHSSRRPLTPRARLLPPLSRLIERGLVTQAAPTQAVTGSQTPVDAEPPALRVASRDLDDLLADARRFIRDDDLDRAEDLLRQALSLRPDDRVIAQNLRRVGLRRDTAQLRSLAATSAMSR